MDNSIADPKERLEKFCQETPECKPLLNALLECNARVSAKSNTKETCMQELFDLTPCVDKCVSQRLFAYLKWTSVSTFETDIIREWHYSGVLLLLEMYIVNNALWMLKHTDFSLSSIAIKCIGK